MATRLYGSQRDLDVLTDELTPSLIAPEEHLATLRWLMDAFESDEAFVRGALSWMEALLVEQLEGCEKARALYEALSEDLRARLKGYSTPPPYLARYQRGAERCTRRAP